MQSGLIKNEIIQPLEIEALYDQNVQDLSGGELQRFAIGATLLKDADIYLFDEMSSYLDVAERIRVAGIIQKLAKKKTVMVVEDCDMQGIT